MFSLVFFLVFSFVISFVFYFVFEQRSSRTVQETPLSRNFTKRCEFLLVSQGVAWALVSQGKRREMGRSDCKTGRNLGRKLGDGGEVIAKPRGIWAENGSAWSLQSLRARTGTSTNAGLRAN